MSPNKHIKVILNTSYYLILNFLEIANTGKIIGANSTNTTNTTTTNTTTTNTTTTNTTNSTTTNTTNSTNSSDTINGCSLKNYSGSYCWCPKDRQGSNCQF